MKSKKFGRLLKLAITSIAIAKDKKINIVEEELGQQLGLSGSAIEYYKLGNVPNDIKVIDHLAYSAVNYGYLNKEWLYQFLEAARHPKIDETFNILFPKESTRNEELVHNNLPSPNYKHFVGRQNVLEEVTRLLQIDDTPIIITGMAGIGKTALVRQVTSYYTQHQNITKFEFNAIVWISCNSYTDISFNNVLDEIVTTLNLPVLKSFDFSLKLQAVISLLKTLRTLLVIDQFENIKDNALIDWILSLPSPSKVLITTRRFPIDLSRVYVFVLGSLNKEEAETFLKLRLVEVNLRDVSLSKRQISTLIDISEGNPLLLNLILPRLKFDSIEDIMNEINTGSINTISKIFSEIIDKLEENSQLTLLTLALDPNNSGLDTGTISKILQLEKSDVSKIIRQLLRSSVIETKPNNSSTPTFIIHTLMKNFIIAHLEATQAAKVASIKSKLQEIKKVPNGDELAK